MLETRENKKSRTGKSRHLDVSPNHNAGFQQIGEANSFLRHQLNIWRV
jgi:hypothetical protein